MLVSLMLGVQEEGVESHRCLVVSNELQEVIVVLERMWVLTDYLRERFLNILNFKILSYLIDRCQELEFYIERVVWHLCLPDLCSMGRTEERTNLDSPKGLDKFVHPMECTTSRQTCKSTFSIKDHLKIVSNKSLLIHRYS